jgi:hypothetical protein
MAKRIWEKMKNINYFAITTDGWTDCRLRKFIAITYHWMDNDFNMHSFCNDLVHYDQSHTCLNVCREINIRIQNAVPKDAVLVSTVTNNGANFVKMARYLHTNLDETVIESHEIDDWDEPIEVCSSFCT